MTKENTGLYRDDGLVATPLTSQLAEKMSKKIHATFKSEDLTLKISADGSYPKKPGWVRSEVCMKHGYWTRVA